jgi:serine/threonine protein kinase
LLDESGQLKVGDFGTAREYSSNMTQGICTPLYGSPEVLRLITTYDGRCDVWSAGLTLYEMITGQMLFIGVKTYDALMSEIKKLEKDDYKIPISDEFHPEWKKLLKKMLVCNYK